VNPYLRQYAIDNDGKDKGSDKGSSPPPQNQPLGSSPASTEVAMITLTIRASSNKKCTLNDDIMMTDVSDDNDEMRQSYSHLCSALGLDDGFDPANPSIQNSMVAL